VKGLKSICADYKWHNTLIKLISYVWHQIKLIDLVVFLEASTDSKINFSWTTYLQLSVVR